MVLALAAAGVVAVLLPVRAQESVPLRLAIAGLVHGHVSGFLRAAQARADVRIVGVYEPDGALLRKYAQRYGLADADRASTTRRRSCWSTRRRCRRSPTT